MYPNTEVWKVEQYCWLLTLDFHETYVVYELMLDVFFEAR
jgi:hypothetical protein